MRKTIQKINIFTPVSILAVSICLLGSVRLVEDAPQASNLPAAITDTPSAISQKPKAASPPVKSSSDSIQSAPMPSIAQKSQHSQASVKQADRILTKDGQVFPIREYRALLSPNDPSANQWWVASNAMTNVWSLLPGGRQTKIAVIDTGFALTHQEFSGRWAINAGESGTAFSEGLSSLNCTSQGLVLNKSCNNIDDNYDGIVDNESGTAIRENPSRLNCTAQGLALSKDCNRLDDDGNGYIDDYRGWDFANFDALAQAGETNMDGDGTTHGTMVAGILGATGNNGVGIAGVNWNSTILPIQALDDDSYGDSYTVGQAIYYAADQGADVISISLGTSADDPYLRLAIQYAIEKGSVVVAASGNDGCNCMVYPANYPEVIAVGALDSSNNPASFSSYGRNLDIVAPGSTLASSTWTKSNQSSSYASNLAGTSFATPFVAGLLGIARSHQPNATWDEIVGAMLENSDRRNLTAQAPRSDKLGYGAARANTMLSRVVTPVQPVIRYQFGGTTPKLGSTRSYQCENTMPATLLHELTKGSQLLYTTNKLEQYKLSRQGWTARSLMHTCIGLPTDLPTTLRVINLPAEIRNQFLKQ